MIFLSMVLPDFPLGLTAILPMIARAMLIGGLLASFGVLITVLAEGNRRIVRWALVIALIGIVMSGDDSPIALVIAVLMVVALLVVQGGLAGWRGIAAPVILGLAVIAHAIGGSARVPTPDAALFIALQIVHLGGVSILIGSAVGFLGMLRLRTRLMPLWSGAVLSVAITGGIETWLTIGQPVGLIGTAYGWGIIAKITLFGVLLIAGLRSRRRVIMSLGLLTASLVVSALLGLLPPGRYIQPIWPFSWQLSLVTLAEAPELRSEVVKALAVLLFCAVLTVVGVMIRRIRWTALMIAIVTAGFALPHLDLLFVQAYPTSYFRSPTDFAATSIMVGNGLYPDHCAACHGATGRGDGPDARTLPIPPADLTADHLWGHSDGELFWWLSHGIEDGRGTLAMPGFKGTLSDNQIWALIDYVRANNAGLAYQATGRWPEPIKVPGFDLSCGGAAPVPVQSLQGRLVRIVFGASAPQDLPAASVSLGVDIVTVRVGAGTVNTAGCHTADTAVAPAFAKLAGVTPDALDGMQFLIDQQGWIRAVQKPGNAPSASGGAQDALLAALQDICAHPLSGAETHVHHHHP